MGYSLPRDKRSSPATEAPVSLRQERAGRADSEYAQQTVGNKGRIWCRVAKKERQRFVFREEHPVSVSHV